jgi:NADH-quinone oxidoreductase subunit L
LSLILASVIILIICVVITYRWFAIKESLVSSEEKQQSIPVRIAYRKFYIDELYDTIFVKPLSSAAKLFYNVFDLKLIDGFINSISKGLTTGSGLLRRLQTGNIGFYIFAMVFGIIAILLFNLILK